MAASKNRLTANEVLRYQKEKRHSSTVLRYFLRWREQQKIPERCDNPNCHFHTQPLGWNGKPLKLILDHIDGINSDNRPEKLRLLCPNCDSQLATRGGRNKGRTEKHEGGFAIKDEEGKKHHRLIAESGHFSTSGKYA